MATMRLRHEILLQRFRHMMVDSGVKPAAVTDAELLQMAKGKTYDEKLAAIEATLSLVPPSFFERRGL
jgi:hypothetical protein